MNDLALKTYSVNIQYNPSTKDKKQYKFIVSDKYAYLKI